MAQRAFALDVLFRSLALMMMVRTGACCPPCNLLMRFIELPNYHVSSFIVSDSYSQPSANLHASTKTDSAHMEISFFFDFVSV